MSFEIEYEWTNVAPSPDELSQRAMAKMCIRINGVAVTSVIDHHLKRPNKREYIIVPLHHVVEWIVSHWHHLFFEIADTTEQRSGFDARHNLAFAGDGFVLPQLSISPTANDMNLRWTASRPDFTELEFIRTGESREPRDEVQEKLGALVDDVLSRFREANVPLAETERMWEAIRGLDEEEEEFVRASALLGIDPFDVDQPIAELVMQFWSEVHPALREDAMACATDANSIQRILGWLTSGLRIIEDETKDDRTSWKIMRRIMKQSHSSLPWQRGYGLAHSYQELRQNRGNQPNLAPINLPKIPRQMLIAPAKRIQGLVDQHSPACIITTRGEAADRFLAARALGAFLASKDDESAPSLLSTLATDFQAITRAFAAELLAPAENLRTYIREDGFHSSTVRDLAHIFRVSTHVISHQIANHKLAPR